MVRVGKENNEHYKLNAKKDSTNLALPPRPALILLLSAKAICAAGRRGRDGERRRGDVQHREDFAGHPLDVEVLHRRESTWASEHEWPPRRASAAESNEGWRVRAGLPKGRTAACLFGGTWADGAVTPKEPPRAF